MFRTALHRGLESGQMTPELADRTDQNFDDVVTEALEVIDHFTMQNKTEHALSALMQMTSLIRSAANVQPRMINKLTKWINKIKSSVYTLAKNLGANSISISVPLSVGISWPVP